MVSKTTLKINYWAIIPILILSDILFSLLLNGNAVSGFVSIIYAIFFIYFYPNRDFKRIAFSWPMKIWALLTLYHLINATIKDVPVINISDYLHGFKIYASISIFAFLFRNNLKQSTYVLFCSLGIWLILAFSMSGFTDSGRLANVGGKGFNAVNFGKHAAIMAIAAIYYASASKKSFSLLLLHLSYPLVFILMSQTRNAFGMVILQLAGYFYSFVMRCKITFKNAVLIILLIIVANVGMDYVMENTGLGGRFQHDFDNAEEQYSSYQTGTFWDYIAGERIVYYVLGWEIFNENPVTGIGLDNFQNYTKGNYPMHVEYMKHLAEGGIIAFLLYIGFIISLTLIIHRARISKEFKFLLISTLIVQLFSMFFSVSYKQPVPVILYSMILSVYHIKKERLINNPEKS